jgi:hypothetical protein
MTDRTPTLPPEIRDAIRDFSRTSIAFGVIDGAGEEAADAAATAARAALESAILSSLAVAEERARRAEGEGRAAGRAEAAEILMEQDAETFPAGEYEDGTHPRSLVESYSCGTEGDYGTRWVPEKVRALFGVPADGGPAAALIERLRGAFDEVYAESDALRSERDALAAALKRIASWGDVPEDVVRVARRALASSPGSAPVAPEGRETPPGPPSSPDRCKCGAVTLWRSASLRARAYDGLTRIWHSRGECAPETPAPSGEPRCRFGQPHRDGEGLLCSRPAAPLCLERSPLGAKCELVKGHEGAHREEGWGQWLDGEPACGGQG